MSNETEPPTQPNDPKPNLLAPIYEHGTFVMVDALPLPHPNTPKTRAARDANAIGQVAALVPVNPAEFMTAVQFVTTAAHGLDCQRRAQALDEAEANRPIHQAATMFRASHSAARVLIRLQAARVQREATPKSADSAILTEHCTRQLMTEALARRAADEAEAARLAAELQAAEAAAAEAARQALPPEPPPLTAADVTPDDIAAAEAYAQTNPTNTNRARILRRKAGFPNWGMFTPPEPNVVNAIVHGHSPYLDSLLPGSS